MVNPTTEATDLSYNTNVCLPGTAIAALLLNLFTTLAIIGINGYIIYFFIYEKQLAVLLTKCSVHFTEAIKGIEFSKLPPVAIAVLADMGGVPLSEVIKAYEKDSYERRAIVYSVMGKNRLAQRFVDDYPSKFMISGYEGEALLTTK